MSDNGNKIGKRFACLRSALGGHVNEFGQLTGINLQMLIDIEDGKEYPGIGQLMNIAVSYGISTDFMLGLTDEANINGVPIPYGMSIYHQRLKECIQNEKNA